jgi:spectinomycin phosphotransferase
MGRASQSSAFEIVYMLEPPPLSTENISSSLLDNFGIQARKLEFLPIGNDSNSWVYKVHTEKESYFLKAKRLAVYEPSLTVPRYLKEQGLHQVVAPLQTRTRALYTTLDGFALILYPFIDGDNGMKLDLTDKQWLEYGDFLKRLHAVKLPDELSQQVLKETFIPKWFSMVVSLHETILGRNHNNSFEKQLIEFWKTKHEEISEILKRTEELGAILQAERLEFVLCHSDIHTANLLIDEREKLFVVDWDNPMLAPKEHDLMFIDAKEYLFYQGYGQTKINSLALAYYHYEWIIQEMSDYANRVFSSKFGKEIKHHALQAFLELFKPGNVVAGAYRADNLQDKQGLL